MCFFHFSGEPELKGVETGWRWNKLTLPGFSYLGPGNSLSSGQPRNDVDRIAREHDRKYQEIMDAYKMHQDKELFYKEIEGADKEFIAALQTSQPQSWWEKVGRYLGKAIIKKKVWLESLFRTPVYPK